MKSQTELSYKSLCQTLALPYANLMRWKGRAGRAQPLLLQPGPKKLGPLPLEKLKEDIQMLDHRKKRTHGVGTLYQRYESCMSRRDLDALIREARAEKVRSERRLIKRVEWSEPGLAWAIDATEYLKDQRGETLMLHVIQDLASRYRFEPLVSRSSCGKEIAAYLKKQFDRYGAPLFLKRDNGSPFNNKWVDELLAEYGVIPLNSPAFYAPYNGGIEKAIREIKSEVGTYLPQSAICSTGLARGVADGTVHKQNHRSRRCLQGKNACQVYNCGQKPVWSLAQRHIIFEWIRTHSLEILQQMKDTNHRNAAAAWRSASVTWLRRQDLITIRMNNKVLPNLSLN